jgi:hypothetical protein
VPQADVYERPLCARIFIYEFISKKGIDFDCTFYPLAAVTVEKEPDAARKPQFGTATV